MHAETRRSWRLFRRLPVPAKCQHDGIRVTKMDADSYTVRAIFQFPCGFVRQRPLCAANFESLMTGKGFMSRL